MSAQDDAVYASEFKNGNFYRSVLIPYLEERKRGLWEKLDRAVLEGNAQAMFSELSGRRKEIAEMETWLDTLFKRPIETKGS